MVDAIQNALSRAPRFRSRCDLEIHSNVTMSEAATATVSPRRTRLKSPNSPARQSSPRSGLPAPRTPRQTTTRQRRSSTRWCHPRESPCSVVPNCLANRDRSTASSHDSTPARPLQSCNISLFPDRLVGATTVGQYLPRAVFLLLPYGQVRSLSYGRPGHCLIEDGETAGGVSHCP